MGARRCRLAGRLARGRRRWPAGIEVDEKYGGGGNQDCTYYLILGEELARAGAHGPGFPCTTTSSAAVARAFTDRSIAEYRAARLSNEEAAMVKWWDTGLCNKVVDRCVQLCGGYGYTREYPVARSFADAACRRSSAAPRRS